MLESLLSFWQVFNTNLFKFILGTPDLILITQKLMDVLNFEHDVSVIPHALDIVWHSNLLSKLSANDFQDALLEWLLGFLCEYNQWGALENILSCTQPLEANVQTKTNQSCCWS